MDESRMLFQEDDYLTLETARHNGISKYRFYKFIQENGYERIGKGAYSREGVLIDDLYVISRRCPKAVFSHDEAFYYHGLSDREPLIHTVTVYSGYNAHRLKTDGKCKAYFVKEDLLDVGKTIVKDSFGNYIPMYDLERTICDLVRSRNLIEIQEFSSVMKAYIARKDKNLNLLMEYAGKFHIENIIRMYMEVLL